MKSERIWISGGRVLDPYLGEDRVNDLFIGDGKIVGRGVRPDGFHEDRRIDAAGLVVSPGFFDVCARLREPGFEYKATIETETLAAVAGGVTRLCMPPDTVPVVDSPAVVQLIQARVLEADRLNVEIIGAMTRGLGGSDLSEMAALRQAGCRLIGNAFAPVENTLVLRRCLEYAASHDYTVVIRPEDAALADQGCAHEGSIATRLGLKGVPYAAETVAIAQVLALIEQTGTRVHFGQVSSACAVKAISLAQDKGYPVTADVSIHQLHLTQEALEGFDPNVHVRPPFRTHVDRDALRQAVKSGVIAAVCSDHQPHEPDAKLDAFPATEPGISALEALLPLTLDLVREGVMDLGSAIHAITAGPHRALNYDSNGLALNEMADLVIFDPDERWLPSEETWLSRGQNTPFWGKVLQGRVKATIFRGRLVYSHFDGPVQ